MPFPGVFLAGCHGERQPVRGFGYGAGAVRERAGEVVHAVEIDCCDPSRVRACEFQDASGPVGLPAAGGVGEKDDRGSVHIGHFQRIPVALMVEFDSPYRGDDLDHFFRDRVLYGQLQVVEGREPCRQHPFDGWLEVGNVPGEFAAQAAVGVLHPDPEPFRALLYGVGL